MGPFKCPDCGVWWAGLEHRCDVVPALSTNGSWGHCHGCSSMVCSLADDHPCQMHLTGYTIT